jgi:hypothetical protein
MKEIEKAKRKIITLIALLFVAISGVVFFLLIGCWTDSLVLKFVAYLFGLVAAPLILLNPMFYINYIEEKKQCCLKCNKKGELTSRIDEVVCIKENPTKQETKTRKKTTTTYHCAECDVTWKIVDFHNEYQDNHKDEDPLPSHRPYAS